MNQLRPGNTFIYPGKTLNSFVEMCMYVRAGHKPGSVSRSPAVSGAFGTMTIHLAPMLPSGSSDLPGNSGGPPSCVPLFGLAPGGVYLAPAVTGRTGELLPHPFTLTPADLKKSAGAVCFLWHFPPRCRDWALPSTLSCGARTFLSPAVSAGQRSSVLL